MGVEILIIGVKLGLNTANEDCDMPLPPVKSDKENNICAFFQNIFELPITEFQKNLTSTSFIGIF